MDIGEVGDCAVDTPLGELRVRDGGRGGAGPVAELPEFFCIDGRGFGGYTAAIAALGATRYAPGKQLRSLRAVFTKTAVAGELELEVLPLVRGRTATSVQVTVRQGGEPVVAALTWFAAPGLLPPEGAGRRAAAGVPGPEDCPRLPWLAKIVPFLGGFDERAVDYPLSAEEFDGGFRVDDGDSIALWAVPQWPAPRDGGGGGGGGDRDEGEDTVSASVAQRLVDVMLFDAHLMDAAYRGAARGTVMTSLDLDVTWHAEAGAGGPTLFRARAGLDGLVANTSATLADVAGTVRATATSQCRVYPPKD
ncbi:thioesterase family protein [Embleya sp. NBC_00888]|uniref:acyl-CoA thioesterase domain-containing protein n=1 Tax=Embleya sp. NBC_00888 TaxID=2975960 RepID=UPI00386F6A41|nr:thioesterase family protein [Embleya sp. NBC_00888]